MEVSETEKLIKFLDELEMCNKDEKKQKQEEMNKLIGEINWAEVKVYQTIKLFNKMHKIMEEKTLSIGDVLLMLKRVGYCKMMKQAFSDEFKHSSLSRRIEKMIIDENMKKDGKNETLLIDLCECYLLLCNSFSSGILSICFPCALKVALKKDESKEAQKEVEMALLALSHVYRYVNVEKELYFDEITEIIQYHQKHRNLTRLAYQSSWQLFINRFYYERELEDAIVNKLGFAFEAARELEELEECEDWKQNDRKEKTEVRTTMRWLLLLSNFLDILMLSGKGCDKLCQNLVKLGRSTRDSQRDVFERVFAIFLMMIRYQPTLAVVYDLLKGGVFDLISDEMQKRTFEDVIARNCFEFLLALSKRLDIEYDDEGEEMKRKATKKEVFEKMEEEGYEDIITSYCEALLDLYENYYTELSLIISDYFIYV